MRFDAKAGTGALFGVLFGALIIAAVVGSLVTVGLDRFTEMLPSQALGPGIGVGALALLIGILGGLRGVKQVQVSDQTLRLIPFVGAPKEYDLASNTFGAHLAYTNNQVTGRFVTISGPAGSQEKIGLNLTPTEFDQLMRILQPIEAGQGAAPWQGQPQGTGPWQGQQQASPAAAPRPRGPLSFEPRTFTVSRAAQLVAAWILIVMGVLLGGGLVVLGIVLGPDDAPEAKWAIFGVGAFILLGLGGLGLWGLSRAMRIPKRIVVCPTSVTFGQRTYAYADLYALELPAPGLGFGAVAKVMTTNGAKTEIPISAPRAKSFKEYDDFAVLLHDAANAVKPVVSYRFSG